MNGRPLTAIFAAVVAAACATSGPRIPEDTFAYSGSPAPATYEVADTVVVGVNSPVGALEIVSGSTLTLGLIFTADSGGVRVTGTVEHLDAVVDIPFGGTETADLDDVSGTLDFLRGPYGVLEVTSFPEVGAPSPMFSLPTLAYLLFPSLAGGTVEPGATWVDTVTSSFEGDVGVTFTTITNHTFVGDTLVDGRPLRHIATGAEVTIRMEMDELGTSADQALTGSSHGFALWDPERRLVVYAQSDRRLSGDMTMPGMPTIPLEMTGPTVLRLREDR